MVAATAKATKPTTKANGYDAYITHLVPTRAGFTFLRWNTAANGSGTTYTASQVYTGNGAFTLFAIWEQ